MKREISEDAKIQMALLRDLIAQTMDKADEIIKNSEGWQGVKALRLAREELHIAYFRIDIVADVAKAKSFDTEALISAAPEMLEALIMAERRLRNPYPLMARDIEKLIFKAQGKKVINPKKNDDAGYPETPDSEGSQCG